MHYINQCEILSPLRIAKSLLYILFIRAWNSLFTIQLQQISRYGNSALSTVSFSTAVSRALSIHCDAYDLCEDRSGQTWQNTGPQQSETSIINVGTSTAVSCSGPVKKLHFVLFCFVYLFPAGADLCFWAHPVHSCAVSGLMLEMSHACMLAHFSPPDTVLNQ